MWQSLEQRTWQRVSPSASGRSHFSSAPAIKTAAHRLLHAHGRRLLLSGALCGSLLLLLSISTWQLFWSASRVHAPAHRLLEDWPGTGSSPPRVSALTPLLASDVRRFLSDYLANADAQSDCPHTELLLAAYDRRSVELVSRALGRRGLPSGCPVRLVLFERDPGLYETWDVLADHYARAPLLTSAALDDARAGGSLAAAARQFDADAELQVISFSVQPVGEDGVTPLEDGVPWWGADILPHGFRVSPSMLLATNTSTRAIQDGYNLPHCSPIWRASLHRRLGGAAPAAQLATAGLHCDVCCDWSFFLRASLSGAKLTHFSLPSPGVVYRMRVDSHNRRTREGAPGTRVQSCERRVVEELGLPGRGLYNNLVFHGYRSLGETTKRLALALATDHPDGQEGPAPTQARAQGLQSLAEWF